MNVDDEFVSRDFLLRQIHDLDKFDSVLSEASKVEEEKCPQQTDQPPTPPTRIRRELIRS